MPLPGAEGEVIGHLALILGGNEADGLLVAVGVVEGDALGVEAAEAGDIGAGVQHVDHAVFHSESLFVAERDGQVAVVQLGGLLGQHGQDGVLNAEADEEQGCAARYAQHRHEEAFFVPEQVAGGSLLGEAHVLPQRSDVLKEDPLARHGGAGQQEGGGLFFQAGVARLPCGDADDRSTEQHAARRHAGVELERKGGHLEHHGLVSLPDDRGEDDEAHHHAEDAARNAGRKAVEQIFARDHGVGVAQRLEGAHLQPVLVHHAGHGGGSHQRRHKKEEHREDPRDGVHPVGVLLEAGEAHGAAPVEHIPCAALDVADLLLGIVNLLLAVGELLLRIGLLGLVFGAGSLQLLFTGIVFGPAVIQLGAGIGKLLLRRRKGGGRCGRSGGKLELPLQELKLHLPQGGFRLGDQFGVGQARRGDESLRIHLLLSGVELLLIAVELT